jgi:hypothetical protein
LQNQGNKSDYSRLRSSLEKLNELEKRKKISKHAAIAIRTSFIYALEAFEKEFGYLWGEDKAENEVLTDIETQFEDKYLKVRNKVLDNGNNNIRRFNGFMENL